MHPEVHQQQKNFCSLFRILGLKGAICHPFFDNVTDHRGAYPQIVPHHGQNKARVLLILTHNAVRSPGCLTFQIRLEDGLQLLPASQIFRSLEPLLHLFFHQLLPAPHHLHDNLIF